VVNVVVETPRGARAKCAYDPDFGAFTYSKRMTWGLTDRLGLPAFDAGSEWRRTGRYDVAFILPSPRASHRVRAPVALGHRGRYASLVARGARRIMMLPLFLALAPTTH
jgi:hypothetical protein